MIRKFVIVAVAMSAFTMSLFAAENTAAEQGEGAIGWTAAQIGLFAPVSYPWGNDWDVNGVDFNLFYMENVRVEGLGLSAFATRTRDILKGGTISTFLNWGDKEVYGFRLAPAGLNFARGDVYGLEVGGFGFRPNMKGVDIDIIGSHDEVFCGFKASGICNISYKEFTGVAASMGLNFSCDVTGAQFGGINFAYRLKGLQLGFFNITEECSSGLQIGLVNIIMSNMIKVLPVMNWYF